MKNSYKIVLMVILSSALFFGFFPDQEGSNSLNYERLHVFLLNLCAGGSLLIYYSEGKRVSFRVILFLIISLAFTLSGFLECYGSAVICAVALACITELVRNSRYTFYPRDFFDTSVPVSEKFHHAALLCLSVGLVLSGAIMTMNTVFLIELPPKMSIDIFFLGFSFPVSLITMSLMFSFMRSRKKTAVVILEELTFWIVNTGVIVFFLFIILELQDAQALISAVLFIAVIVIFFLFRKLAGDIQQKDFLSSGILFLVMTAVTGMGYIILKYSIIDAPGIPDSGYPERMLLVHRYISLYGWNLIGLFIIIRYDDFPLRVNSSGFIAAHWITVIVLSPLGKYYPSAAFIALAAYGILLYMVLLSRGSGKKELS